MWSDILFFVAGSITFACAVLLWEAVWRQPRFEEKHIGVLLLAAMTMSFAATSGLHLINMQTGVLHFSLPLAVALCTLLVQIIYLLGLLLHGVRNLGLVLLPITAIPLFALPLLPQGTGFDVVLGSVLQTSHWLIALLAYAVLTIAALHAFMQLQLDYALKHKFLSGTIGKIMSLMPSLIEVERHMYAQVRWATALLLLGILTGLSWQWQATGHFNLLSHKILLSLFSFFTLCMLMFGYRQARWHSKRASFMVLAAYLLLLLAYFGVKFIQA
ncbi:MAG: cytochrome c biogenesis protein CcsA [Mariprofundales bacterium]